MSEISHPRRDSFCINIAADEIDQIIRLVSIIICIFLSLSSNKIPPKLLVIGHQLFIQLLTKPYPSRWFGRWSYPSFVGLWFPGLYRCPDGLLSVDRGLASSGGGFV